MVSFTPVQWLQTIISNCMQMISIENKAQSQILWDFRFLS